jgi:hypothetical protein
LRVYRTPKPNRFLARANTRGAKITQLTINSSSEEEFPIKNVKSFS